MPGEGSSILRPPTAPRDDAPVGAVLPDLVLPAGRLDVPLLHSHVLDRHTVTVAVNVTVAVADTVTVKVPVCCIGMAYWHAVFDMLF